MTTDPDDLDWLNSEEWGFDQPITPIFWPEDDDEPTETPDADSVD